MIAFNLNGLIFQAAEDEQLVRQLRVLARAVGTKTSVQTALADARAVTVRASCEVRVMNNSNHVASPTYCFDRS